MKSAPVYFTEDFKELENQLKKASYDQVFVLTDSNTRSFCLPEFLRKLKIGIQPQLISTPAGEAQKSLESAGIIWEKLTQFGATRRSLLICLGGGMITDLGGFAASLYKRGIDFIHVPTSLLAMVDASIGGKTGVDFKGVKNLIGTFEMPKAIYIYTPFLNTLPQREFKSGLAEMLKHGLIYDKSHWEKLSKLDPLTPETLSELIVDSGKIKIEITEKDPKEKGLRKILNFGHTAGHAIESQSLSNETPMLHGEAVAAGMLVETVIALEKDLISGEEMSEIFDVITKIFDCPPIVEKEIPELIQWMKHDKKNAEGNINFSLPHSIGKSKFNVTADEDCIASAIRFYNRKLDSLKIQ